MRHLRVIFTIACLFWSQAGCAPDLIPPEADVLTSVAGAAAESPDDADAQPTSEQQTESVPPANEELSIAGSLFDSESHELYELGSSAAGDLWSVAGADVFAPPAPMVVVLFDADYNLLMRNLVTATQPLRHVMREFSPQVYLGVTPPYGGDGGAFDYAVKRNGGHAIPPPQPQVVWLNFGAGSQICVHRRSGISFPAFDGAMLGDRYAGETETIKQAIVQTMQEDYALYDVVILTSDNGPPPYGPYSTIHFGSEDPGLLGLADNVDSYNEDPAQDAIVFVGTFALFETMALAPDEMGLMVGNVASHELGHLLGLYHTCDPDDIMDTTGSAWDLADNQSFTRTELDPTVFPTGWEDSPQLLEDTVGLRPGVVALDPPANTAKMIRRAMIRRFAREQIRWMCGTCQHLDDH